MKTDSQRKHDQLKRQAEALFGSTTKPLNADGLAQQLKCGFLEAERIAAEIWVDGKTEPVWQWLAVEAGTV